MIVTLSYLLWAIVLYSEIGYSWKKKELKMISSSLISNESRNRVIEWIAFCLFVSLEKMHNIIIGIRYSRWSSNRYNKVNILLQISAIAFRTQSKTSIAIDIRSIRVSFIINRITTTTTDMHHHSNRSSLRHIESAKWDKTERNIWGTMLERERKYIDRIRRMGWTEQPFWIWMDSRTVGWRWLARFAIIDKQKTL